MKFKFKIGRTSEGWDIIPLDPESMDGGDQETAKIMAREINATGKGNMPDFATVEMVYMGIDDEIVCLILDAADGKTFWVVDQYSAPKRVDVRMD